jgi:hypothetical protein
MKDKHLQHDTFLYEFAIRMLAVMATILFSLLFFYGASASENTALPEGKEMKSEKTTIQTGITSKP